MTATGYNPLPVLPTTFLPTWVPGCALWLRADLGITQSGGTVSDWADQSGSGVIFSQSTGAKQPTYTSSGINSLPTITFDGANNYMSNGSFALAQPLTFFFVVNNTMAAGQGCWESGNGAYLYINSTVSYTLVDTAETGVIEDYSNSSFTRPIIISGIMNGTSSQFPACHIKGILNSVGLSGGLTIGSLNGGAYPMNTQMSEVLFYNTALTPLQLGTIFQYLCNRYNLT